mgnify:CR=1 FL=1
MKHGLIALAAAILLLTALAVPSFAETNAVENLFLLKYDEAVSEKEALAYAVENGFSYVVLEDFPAGATGDFCDAAAQVGVGVFIRQDGDTEIKTSTAESPAFAGVLIGWTGDAFETMTALSSAAGEYGAAGVWFSEPVSSLPEDLAASVEQWRENGVCGWLFAEIDRSVYSEAGYAEELAAWISVAGETPLATVNDLGRILSPVVSGDFYGDEAELCYQYTADRMLGAWGFAVDDYAALKRNAYGSASSLIAEFGSETLFDVSECLAISSDFDITRPAAYDLTFSGSSYTIMGTSDPDQPLYMDGAEIERISTTGLFTVNVPLDYKTNTFVFSQGGKSITVTIRKPSSDTVSTISKITSCQPSADLIVTEGQEITLSCIAPSGGSVTATVDGQTVSLKQAAATAYNGVPATFKKTFTFTGRGDYPAGETSEAGTVVFALTYNGSTSTRESAGKVYVGDGSTPVLVRTINNNAGIEPEAQDSGAYLTTLRKGCTDEVLDSTDSWYLLSCGGYVKKTHVEVVTGASELDNSVSSAAYTDGGNYEAVTLSCSVLPAYEAEFCGRYLKVKLYHTSMDCDVTALNDSSRLFFRLRTEADETDGSVTLFLYSRDPIWGYDVSTDEEANTLRIALKSYPKLSDSLSKPLEGVTIAVAAGHGGPDPGALSVMGEKGVYESEINYATCAVLVDKLMNLGADVTFIYTGDEKLDAESRMSPAHDVMADFYICIHANAIAESADANLYCGTEVYFHEETSRRFAELLAAYISTATGRDNEEAHQDYYTVTRMTYCPSVMIETGYLSNPAELENLTDPMMIERTAWAIVRAVTEMLE